MRHVWQFLGTWTFEPLPAVLIAAAAVGYVWAAVTVTRRNPTQPWPAWRTACFVTALALTWIVLLGPIGAYDDVFFWAHMVQHITLMMLAAPLIVLGGPVLLLLRTADPVFRRRRIVPVLRSRAVHILTDPVLTWVLFAGVLLGTHFSPFYDYALRHPDVHNYVEHPLYLGVALLFYYPLIGGNPCPRRIRPLAKILSLGLMMVPETLTGFFIYASNYVLYPFYSAVRRPFGLAPLADQQLGGILMWSGGMMIDSVWLVLAIIAWLNSDALRTRRIDGQIARDLARRAARSREPAPSAVPGLSADRGQPGAHTP